MDRNFNNNANNDMNNNINNEVNGKLKCNIAPDIDNTFKNVEKITDDVKNDIHKIDKDNPTLHPDSKETNPMFKSGNNQDEPMPNSRHIDISLKDSISRVSAANIVENPENSKESNESDLKKALEADGHSPSKKAETNVVSTDGIRYKESPTFNLKETLIMVLLTGIVCTIASGTIVNHKYSTKNGTSYNTLLKDENIQEFLDVYATLNDSYYQTVDKKTAIEGAIAGLMSGAGDSYTSYLDKEDADILNDSLNGKYEGIGIAINGKETGLIEKVYSNSPAKEADLQPKDRITAINGESIEGKSSSEIAKLIKESPNKKASLTILRNEETFVVKVSIKTLASPVVDYTVLEGNNKKVGYLAISSFSDTLTSQVEAALNELEQAGIESLILDLRNNGGGLLTAAKDTASLFLEKGKAIYGLEGNDKTGKTKFYYDETSTSKNYPIVVLVNGGTASASEILTAALKDSYGATTVGTTTYGKGKVQQTKKLSDGSLVKYTTSRWLTPNNECIDEYGISPDYGIEIEYQYDNDKNIVGYTDTQLAKARSLSGLPEYDETGNNSNNTEINENNSNSEANGANSNQEN